MSFERIVNRMLDEHEKGYVVDAGGPTNWGISQRGNPELTTEQIKNMTKLEAIERYRVKEWKKIHGDDLLLLSERLASILFDFAVNSGVRQSVKYLQLSLATMGFQIKVDGFQGPATLAAVKNANKKILICTILSKRAIFLTGLRNWDRNKNGWIKRLFYVGIC